MFKIIIVDFIGYILGLFNILNVIFYASHRSLCRNCVLYPASVLPTFPLVLFLFTIFPVFYFPSSLCCSLLEILSALWFWESINQSLGLVLLFLFQYFSSSGFMRPFSFPLCVSLSLYFLPRGSSWELHQLQGSLVCACVFVCKFVCASMRVGVLCGVNGLQDPLSRISNVLTGSRVMTKTACLSLTEKEREEEDV